MWIKYKWQRINLNNLKYFSDHTAHITGNYRIKYSYCGSDEIFWLDFQNEEKKDKAWELIDIFMAFQKQNKFDYFCYMKNNTKVRLEFLESNLLDLDKELNNE